MGGASQLGQPLGQRRSLDDLDAGAQALGLLEPDLDLFGIFHELGTARLHVHRDPGG